MSRWVPSALAAARQQMVTVISRSQRVNKLSLVLFRSLYHMVVVVWKK